MDTCSSSAARNCASTTLSYIQRSSLASETAWRGRVFVNPPFGCQGGHSLQGLSLFFSKAVKEFATRRASEVFVLLKAAVGYHWFRDVHSHPHVLFQERLAFWSCEEQCGAPIALLGNPHGSVGVYLGPNVNKFCKVFGLVGHIPEYNSWSYTGCWYARKYAEPL